MVKAERRALRNQAQEATVAGEKQDPPCRHELRCTIYGRTRSMIKIQVQQNSRAILLDSSNVNEGFRVLFRRSPLEVDAAKSACEWQEYSKDDALLLQKRRDAHSLQHMYGKERVQGSTRLDDETSCFQQRAGATRRALRRGINKTKCLQAERRTHTECRRPVDKDYADCIAP